MTLDTAVLPIINDGAQGIQVVDHCAPSMQEVIFDCTDSIIIHLLHLLSVI